jgi:2-amino-4-hydroxy-6-hydroxymethyldihydropteridine diphosphokinase
MIEQNTEYRIQNTEYRKQSAVFFLALGSNIEPRENYLALAILELGRVGVLLRASRIYETAPLGPSQSNYLNQVVQLRTKLEPVELLVELKKIEKKLGRKRRERWGEREIDLDILLVQPLGLNSTPGVAIWSPDLQIPHADMQHRRFVLAPLAELAPDFSHPVLGLSMCELLKLCQRDLAVRVWKN